MGVVPAGTELSRATTVALLSGLLGEDPVLHTRVPAGDYAEFVLGRRARQHPVVRLPRQGGGPATGGLGLGQLPRTAGCDLPGRGGADRRAAKGTGDRRRRPAHRRGRRCHRSLARRGARPDLAGRRQHTPAGGDTGTPAESDEDYLRRYLAAAEDRLAWLRDQSARPTVHSGSTVSATAWFRCGSGQSADSSPAPPMPRRRRSSSTTEAPSSARRMQSCRCGTDAACSSPRTSGRTTPSR